MTRSLWFSTRYLLALAFVLLPSLCLSAEVNRETGKQVAEKFMMEHVTAHGNWGGSSAPFITDVETVLHENKVVAYNMKVHPSGHILVPYHDEFSPVLLYSDTSDFIPERISEKHSVESWIIPEITATYKKITERMASGKATVAEESKVGKAWKRLLAQDQRATLDIPLTATVGPLIGATWSQGYPFNYYTPFNSCGGTNDNTLTGCVATAMGQLMKYWNWPDSGTGSHSYTWNGTPLSASFAHPYDWTNMPNNLSAGSSTTQKEAVGRLLSDAGIAVEMDYGCAASGAYINQIAPALVNYFKYRSPITPQDRSLHDAVSWFNLVKGEIDATPPRPMLFSIITTDGQSAHEVVIDGYQTGATNMVHVNLGWGGSYTGYYDITHDFTTGVYTWSGNDQLLLTGIQPQASTYSLCGTVHSGSATGPGLDGATVKIAGKSAITDMSGDFCVTGIASGSYTFVVSKSGYAPYVKAAYNVSSNLSGLDFFLLPAYTVSGTVHSGSLTGPLLAGATVKLGTSTATTGSNGAFSLSVAAGTYSLSVSKAGFATFTKTTTVAGDQNLNLYLAAGYRVSGTVHNGGLTGPGLAGATVKIGNCTAVTNSYGVFTVSGVAPGAYTLVISKSSYPTFTKVISVTGNLTGLNYALPLMISGTVHAGSVTGPGLAGAVVKLGAKSTTTDSYGRFSISGFAPGTYQLTIIRSGYATSINKAYTVSVSRSGLNFYLGYVVSGKVHLGSATGPAAAGASVSIGNFKALTDSYGAFTIAGIPTGTYVLSISKSGYATYTNAAYRVAATVTGLNFYLAKAYSMSGKVHAGTITGPVLAGAVVKIAGKVAVTDAAGSFTLTGIAGGSNLLTISRTGYTTYRKSVTVSANQTGLNFALVKSQAGRLSISYTTPVPGYDDTGRQVWRLSATVHEAGGVGVAIKGVVWEFYDGSGALTNRQTNTAADFATWFGSSTIGANQSATAKFVAYIGGRSSGSVVLTLNGVDTLGHAVTAKGKAVFASAAVTPGAALRQLEGEWMKGE